MSVTTIFWHRRDLRVHDNAGLYRALSEEKGVLPIFIFDRCILDKLEEKDDARVTFIHRSVTELAEAYAELGGSFRAYYGEPKKLWPEIIKAFPDLKAVYTNRDYEPYAKDRDQAVEELLLTAGIRFQTYKDHVIFEGDEVTKKDGGPYTVYTPYMKRWRAKLAERTSEITREDGTIQEISYYLKPYATADYAASLATLKSNEGGLPQVQASPPAPQRGEFLGSKSIPSLADMNFEASDIDIPPTTVSRGLIRTYDETRNFPAIEGTSRLGVHFRHGTISIREKALAAMNLNDTYVNELIWRDFYSQILQHFPRVDGNCFRPEYEGIPWENDEDHFKAWCEGRTGVPIVDAGMRELNATGYMHNRVRMIVASYLTKHLLIDWRWGEAYFAKKLLDFDLASNNGGWQWAASCGTDAQPYFRIFNAESQQKKFDPKFKYIGKWVPEYDTDDYPAPLVEHKAGRERALAVYKETLAKAKEDQG
ncbi:MAG: deoxyribodipyrimidine photo-lyase [Bacteroidota bacterium]